MPKLKTALLMGLVVALSIAMVGCIDLLAGRDEPEAPLAAENAELPEWLLLSSRQNDSEDEPDTDSEENETEKDNDTTETASVPEQAPAAPQAPASSGSTGSTAAAPAPQAPAPSSNYATGYPGEIGSRLRNRAEEEAAAKKAAEDAAKNDGDWTNIFGSGDDKKGLEGWFD